VGTLRKMKKNMQPKFTHQLNLPFVETLVYDRGFNAGAAEQRQSDINCLVDLLEGLEEWPGIGEVTAAKIRTHFLNKFGIREDTV
jgi:hypothetical protein